MPDAHLVPGLWKIDGYSVLQQLVADNFAIEKGDPTRISPANYFELPYDWRRDNRVAARRLQRLVDEALPLWRKHSGAADAKAIVLAHSMGGLVARHWLEMLEGWRSCRALITFGTPYRGAPKAVGYLANGYKMLFDLSETMRSFTAVYQLLPIYPAVRAVEGAWVRVGESDAHPRIDREKTRQALQFHRDIEAAVKRHQDDPLYLRPHTGYRILPVVGVSQPTWQSAVCATEGLRLDELLPDGIEPAFAAGDGTVPRVSATPIELSDAFAETFIADRHAALQANTTILTNLREQLRQMQARNHGAVRGPFLAPDRTRQRALALVLDDSYEPGEPVEIRVQLREIEPATILPPNLAATAPLARITRIDAPRGSERRNFVLANDGWVLSVGDLSPGLYRVEVRLTEPLSDGTRPSPVRDLFEIGGPPNPGD